MYRKIPWGWVSIALFIIGALLSLNIGRTLCPGNLILKAVGISVHSRLYNKFFLSLLLFVAGCILGIVFRQYEGASLGRNLNLIFGFALIIILLGGYVFGVDLLYPLYQFP